jgi:hypothetical protein
MISPGSLQRLDIAVAAAVEGPPQDDPPAAPAEGSCYLVGDAPTGDWMQFPAHLAGYGGGGWRFLAPTVGMAVFVKSTETLAVYRSTGWDCGTVRATTLDIDGVQVVGPQAQAIADPVAGATIDSEARSAVSAILSALRQHGLISA